MNNITLSEEQRLFVQKALEGNNILVDACIGSGKTTAIQFLCDALPGTSKILYLTYNKLLKLDARAKIKNKNVTVTNYHGFAYMCLARAGIRSGISDLIQNFNHFKPFIGTYNVLIIDEYQDIESELAEMLNIIKDYNPSIQIVAVGDMKQKIYDKTTLNVPEFMDRFIGTRLDLEFTQCFRLSAEHAAMLGRVWNKKIIGINPNCTIRFMSKLEVVNFIKDQNPSDVLCLGARAGDLSDTLNTLEYKYPEKFNKNTIYASIRDNDGGGRVEPKIENGIFTTYDSSKGLEKKICVLFDFTEDYWTVRSRMPQQSYEILRNIFCVAASRGKEQIIFVQGETELLSEKTLSTPTDGSQSFEDMNISEMFDFKYKEDVEDCYRLLDIDKIDTDISCIPIKTSDGLIDISMCIGIYQEASYFKNYDLVKDLELLYDTDKDKSQFYIKRFRKATSEQKQILVLTAAQTHQNRYMDQVSVPFIDERDKEMIHDRLSTEFTPDEEIQVRCEIKFPGIPFKAIGFADVLMNDTVYELKFVQELSHEHFLQCACYVYALGLQAGILWNVRDNTKYLISIKNRNEFRDLVLRAITKRRYNGIINKSHAPGRIDYSKKIVKIPETKERKYSGLKVKMTARGQKIVDKARTNNR